MKCLDLSHLLEYQNNLLDKSTSEKIRKHLQTCSRCQELENKLKRLINSFNCFSLLNKSQETSQCYEDLQILSIIEGKSNSPKEKEFYNHLLDHPICIDQMISLDNFLDDIRTEGIITSKAGIKFQAIQIFDNLKNSLEDRIRWIGSIFKTPRPVFQFAGLLVTLIILVILLYDHGQIIPNSFKTREPITTQFGPAVQLLEPSNNSVIRTERLQFHWSQITNATSYNFLLLNEQGNIIWEEKTTNTNLTLPQEIHLQPSGKYFWQVECFFDQGGSIISELASFSIIDR